MILSMTGYGKAVAIYKKKKIHVEIKSLNGKTFDLSVRMATLYREKEIEVRRYVAQELVRGKTDLSIWIEKDDSADAPPIQASLVEQYYNQVKEMSQRLGIEEPKDWFALLLRMPEVMAKGDVEMLEEDEWAVVRQAVENAVAELKAFRQQEGKALQTKFEEKLDNITSLLAGIEPYESLRVERIRSRIVENLKSLPDVDYDKNRLEQEMIYYIEKLDISEEKQRLTNHLSYFRKTMNEEACQGKKLGFIAQEMGREINTTGSKSNLAEMQNIVVKMKDELEQIKEQVLNVL
ncbi:MAG: YicC family protein [Prevotella sp.]|nr:YicC family protein [Prevotella sp.]